MYFFLYKRENIKEQNVFDILLGGGGYKVIYTVKKLNLRF